MLRVLLYLWENYGLDSLQLGVICFLGWKLATNHLKHIADKINTISQKLTVFEKDLNKSKERISKLEGKLE